MTDEYNHFLIFYLEDKRYALHISAVEKVFRAVEITPVPDGPDILMGVVNIQGLITPVINIRKKLGLPDRDIKLTDVLIMAKGLKDSIAILADGIFGIRKISEKEVTGKDDILPGIKYITGVMKFEEELILIHNLDDFLSGKEISVLEEIIG